MLAVFYGNDRIRAGKAASAFIQKQEIDEIIFYDETISSSSELLNLAEQSALFGGSKLIKCDGVFENDEVEEIMGKEAQVFRDSANIFVFLESSITAGVTKKLKEVANHFEEYKALPKKESFNVFSLADALGRKDKKALWVLLLRAYRAGKSAEEISGTLFWQLKTLLILKQGGGSTLSSYVVSKNRALLKNFKNDEIENLAAYLTQKYHDARRGRGDLETSLERFTLSL